MLLLALLLLLLLILRRRGALYSWDHFHPNGVSSSRVASMAQGVPSCSWVTRSKYFLAFANSLAS